MFDQPVGNVQAIDVGQFMTAQRNFGSLQGCFSRFIWIYARKTFSFEEKSRILD